MVRLRPLLYLLPPLLLSAWAYWPITANYFHGDDFQHLYLIAEGRLGEFLVTPHGGHMLVARNALFALTHAVFGVDPRGYFWIALLTHLVNVGLLFAVIDAFTGSRRLACAGAALWGVSPLNVEALGWYSVYGQVALATVILAVLWRIARAARDDAPLSRRQALAWYLLVIVGATCFGTGIGFAMALPVALWLCLRAPPHHFTRRLFASLLIVVPALYVLVQVLYWAAAGQAHDSVLYPGLAIRNAVTVLYMTLNMVLFGAAKTLVGTWMLEAPYPGVLLLSLAVLYGLLMAAALWIAGRAPRRAILACLLLAVGPYGIIAAGRAVTAPEAWWLLILLGQAPRYHYAPALPLIIGGCVALAVVAGRMAMPSRLGSAGLTLWIAALALGVYLWPRPIDHFDTERRQVAMLRTTVGARVAQAPPGADVYLLNGPMLPVNFFTPMTTFPGQAGLFVVYFPDNTIDGHRVRFIVRPPKVIAAARRHPGSRTAELLVTPDEARALDPGAAPPARVPVVPRSAPSAGSSRNGG
ncbi:MAG TPA: hypothetical protein VL049_29470 [Candidatus Dormibacteraeota bacterium]|nr:hypothetical protein [Candidatus Dormibacteraeota bacterium]